MSKKLIYFLLFIGLFSCELIKQNELEVVFSKDIQYKPYQPKNTDLSISRSNYYDKLYGFWLG